VTFCFAEALRLWFVLGVGATCCLEEEVPHVLDFPCVGEGWPESRRSVKARSIMNECRGESRHPKSGTPLKIYQILQESLWAAIKCRGVNRAESLRCMAALRACSYHNSFQRR
jgi:hypothetical protein